MVSSSVIPEAIATHIRLAELIETKRAVVGVIGLGYVGLPLIRAFSSAGFRCLGFDVDQSKVDKLNAGQSYIKHIDSGAASQQLIRERTFEPTADMSRLVEADCIIICVPTPLNESRDPDLSYIEGTAARHRQDAAPRPARRAGEHDLSDDDADNVLADPRGDRAASAERITSWRSAPSARTPATRIFRRRPSPRWSAGSTTTSGELACAMYGHAIVKVVRGRPAWRSPRRARSSKTPTAP